MPNTHPHIPRYLIISLAAVIAMALLAGIFRAFAPARAATITSANTMAPATDTPTASEEEVGTSNPIMKPADTTGIIALAIILVVVIIFGTIWGRRTALLRIGRK
jgi:cbb3-type cytochrome oxidase subunit 3